MYNNKLMQNLKRVRERSIAWCICLIKFSDRFNHVRILQLKDQGLVGSPAGPAMAWPLFLSRNFFNYPLPFKVIAQLPPYDSTSALHGRTTFQKPTTALKMPSLLQWGDWKCETWKCGTNLHGWKMREKLVVGGEIWCSFLSTHAFLLGDEQTYATRGVPYYRVSRIFMSRIFSVPITVCTA